MKTDSLLFKFAVIFVVFTAVITIMSGINTYINQTDIYKRQCEENMEKIAAHLEDLIQASGSDFIVFQEYFLEHFDEMNVPLDYPNEYLAVKENYERMFAQKYPGKTLGIDIQFVELDDETKMAYTRYKFEYWFSTFQRAMESFDIKYAYYLAPSKQPEHMIWMIDGIREEKIIDGKKYILLCTDVHEPRAEHQKMWEAWETGKRPEGYDTYDNEFGKTYAYYTPLFLDGKKIGLIGVEIEIDDVNKAILQHTLRQMAGMFIILVLCVLVMMWYIHKRYISKLSHLQSNIREYATIKDPAIVTTIKKDVMGSDEIAALSMQIAAMIIELENYMTNLWVTARELSSTKKQADELNKLAHKDALTGIRNKTAYDNEVKRLEWALDDGYTKFGIAMIDLNFLKRINDTYGHEQGNVAIKKLCRMVCDIFAHSPVFRIGGDEFVVILENEDYDNIESLIQKFNAELDKIARDKTLEYWERISASIGYALYDPDTDNSVNNVFKRADKAMYMRKKEMKAVRMC